MEQSESASQRLDSLIQGCLAGFLGQNPGYSPEDFKPGPYTAEEASGFLMALDSGVFELESDGLCRPVGLRATGCYELIYIADRNSRHINLWREWLTHSRAVAELHVLYRYPRENIAVEIEPFDGMAFSDSNSPVVAIEAKWSPVEVDMMLATMNALSDQDSPLDCHPDHKLNNWEKKFRGLLMLRPQVFAAVAPGVRKVFDVAYPAGRRTAQLVERDDIPRYREPARG